MSGGSPTAGIAVIPSVLKVLRRFLPASARRRARELLFEWLSLNWDLPTAIHIHLAAYGDWVIYNEIFVSGEYDRALAIALDTPTAHDAPRCIVDLGANTGFFTLRAMHEARKRGIGGPNLAIFAVEGHPRCIARFRTRLASQPTASERVRLVHGLVGERTGDGVLHEDIVDVSNSVHRPELSGRRGSPAATVPYVDLSTLLAHVPRIDLVKCDIEGSELRFIENYPDVLAKTEVAVFEFHRDLCDVDRCQALLRQYGFAHHATFRPDDVNFTYGVWR